ncbi:MAG: PD-(D/E)XK nuclease family protein [Cyanobacteria bacterium J06621_11]
MLPLSQSHLSLLDTCARRYEYVFFDSLTGPSSYEQHAKTQWGSQFHLLMQQRALNLPVEALAQVDTEMSASLSALQVAAPEVFEHLPETRPHTFSQSEHRRTLAFNGYLLTAVYDLVVIQSASNRLAKNKNQGLIFDWKTHQQPPPQAQLKRDWQTRLYRYLLCETSELSPDEIAMTYWFVRLSKNGAQSARSQPNDKPDFYKFSYSIAEHEQTQHDLQMLTNQLSEMREATHFPKVAIEKGVCDRCPFNVRCDRQPANQATLLSPTPHSYQLLKTARQLSVENIPEMPL